MVNVCNVMGCNNSQLPTLRTVFSIKKGHRLYQMCKLNKHFKHFFLLSYRWGYRKNNTENFIYKAKTKVFIFVASCPLKDIL